MAIQAEVEAPSRRTKLLSALGFRPRRQAAVPSGMRVYTVGDIHGCAVALDRLHARIADDAASYGGEKVIIYLGDYIDRGPDSRGVVERLIGAPLKGFTSHFIKGNHDAAFLSFLDSAQYYRAWRGYGAPETLLSYGVRPPLFDSEEKFEEARRALVAVLPREHLKFFRALEPMIVIGDYAFVHAGVRPGLPIDDQSEDDLLWIREEFLNHTAAFEKIVVHGHTPVPSPIRLRNRIAVDTGVYATGVLSCVVLEDTHHRFLQARSAEET